MNVCDIRFVITLDIDRRGNIILKRHGVHRDLFKDTLFGHSGLCSRWESNISNWDKLTQPNSLGEFSIVSAASHK